MLMIILYGDIYKYSLQLAYQAKQLTSKKKKSTKEHVNPAFAVLFLLLEKNHFVWHAMHVRS